MSDPILCPDCGQGYALHGIFPTACSLTSENVIRKLIANTRRAALLEAAQTMCAEVCNAGDCSTLVIDGLVYHVSNNRATFNRTTPCRGNVIRALAQEQEVVGEKLMQHKNLTIVHKNGQPHGIRDESGFLLFFVEVQKWNGQEERYRRDIEEQYALADYLLNALKKRAPTKEQAQGEGGGQ